MNGHNEVFDEIIRNGKEIKTIHCSINRKKCWIMDNSHILYDSNKLIKRILLWVLMTNVDPTIIRIYIMIQFLFWNENIYYGIQQ